jgi:hypothetical protein
MADFTGEVLAEDPNVSGGVGDIGKHRSKGVLRASCRPGVRIVEAGSGGGELAGGVGDDSGMEV